MERFSLRKALAMGAVLTSAQFALAAAHPKMDQPLEKRQAVATSSPSLTSLSPSVVQTASSTVVQTSGSVNTALETDGNPASQPFPTSVDTATSTVSLINTETTVLPTPNVFIANAGITVADIFSPMASPAPPPQISTTTQHPVPREGIVPQTPKLETNKFYANFFLGDQQQPSFTYPYSVFWAAGNGGGANSYGLAVSQIEQSQLVVASGTPPEYFINPGGLQYMVLSAAELNSQTTLTTDTLTGFSINVNLNKVSGNTITPVIQFPLVQGQGFVTGVYTDATPLLQSTVAFLKLTYNGKVKKSKIHKYTVLLGDYSTWVFYVKPDDKGYKANAFTLVNGYNIQSGPGFSGIIQVAKIEGYPDVDTIYDKSAGVYATGASISGSVSGTSGTWSLTWTKAGSKKKTLMMFALPHQIATLQGGQVTDVQMRTTTKGNGTLVVADSWTFAETLQPDIGFAPWSPAKGSTTTVSEEARQLINDAATLELSENIAAQTDLNSMYYSGKALAKFAAICYATSEIANNQTLAISGLKQLESAFATFVNNQQPYPLLYETAWGGVVSSASYVTGQPLADFGNTYYNDHHFHYGYFVYAAAVIGYLDPSWLTSENTQWVNSLIRDYANPSDSDPYFPFSRMFDWYHGHSWAAGLFEAADGKNQESSSEDTNSIWAMKLWGSVTGDTAMEARATLMMAVQARSLQDYYLYTTSNTIEPAFFTPNKVAGILFDNKIDHTTYFGNNIEYIEGIHMIPIQAFSAYTRTKTFVQQEWKTYFKGYVKTIESGWRGIVEGNFAIIHPKASYKFFSKPNFNMTLLDGGASLTWYRAYSAALGGSD